MSKEQSTSSETGYERWSDRLQYAHAEETRLIAQEEQAERRVRRTRARLDDALEQLQRAQRRVDRRREQVLAAQDELKWCQQMRIAGPQNLSPATTDELVLSDSDPGEPTADLVSDIIRENENPGQE